MGILTRLAREGMVMRSLVFPTGLVVGTLLVTLGVLAWSRGPDTVAMLADDPALAMVEEAGFTDIRHAKSQDSEIADYEGLDRKDPWRQALTLYLEARRPV